MIKLPQDLKAHSDAVYMCTRVHASAHSHPQVYTKFSAYSVPKFGAGGRFKFGYISADIKDHPVAKRMQVIVATSATCVRALSLP